MHTPDDLNFLRFFLTEPIYLIPEAEPQKIEQHEETTESEANIEEKAVQEANGQEQEEKASDTEVKQNDSLPIPETEGENQKGVLVLFYQQQHRSLSNEERDFLGNILKAVNLGFNDIALCNWAPLEQAYEQQKNIFESIQQIKSEKLLVFGDLPLAWSLSHFFQKYHITEDAEGRKLLLADDLQSIAQNRDFKVQLWNALKKMFQ
ncbi:hypothetical protein WJR50_21090 [Catalinimonas sp. 4WD22]|uniref:hypothetical protein n=1 Tax=Catalinimonas locisalis TaxID=3133978 RepID=UPI0031010891